jgi:membrane protein implicated in regulation of membrane protease activity
MWVRRTLANLVTLAFLFGALVGINALSGDVPWLQIAVILPVVFVTLLLIERFLGKRDRTSSDS